MVVQSSPRADVCRDRSPIGHENGHFRVDDRFRREENEIGRGNEVPASNVNAAMAKRASAGRLRRRLLLGFVILFALLVPFAFRQVRAAAHLLRLAGPSPLPSFVDVDSGTFTLPQAPEATSPPIRARIYLPTTSWPSLTPPRGVVLAHGVHHLGIDEPRLVGLARSMAESGLVVLTPELSALADYHVDDPSNLETLRASVHWLAARRDLVAPGGVGLMGVSFGGGLSLRVAEEPVVSADLAYVVSIGGHHDMRRVARFFASDVAETPDGDVPMRAHDYGMAVLVYGAPERFVSAEDAPWLRRAVRAFLHETYPLAWQEALHLSPEGRAVFERIFRRDTQALAPKLRAAMPDLEKTMLEASAIGHMDLIPVPVFLLHGAHDNVVPPSEARFAAIEAEKTGEVHLLVTPKIGHAELGDEGGMMATLELVHFMSEMLDA